MKSTGMRLMPIEFGRVHEAHDRTGRIPARACQSTVDLSGALVVQRGPGHRSCPATLVGRGHKFLVSGRPDALQTSWDRPFLELCDQKLTCFCSTWLRRRQIEKPLGEAHGQEPTRSCVLTRCERGGWLWSHRGDGASTRAPPRYSNAARSWITPGCRASYAETV